MKYTNKSPRWGETRKVTRFLWFPKTIWENDDKGYTRSTRWLEKVTYQETYHKGRVGDFWRTDFWIYD